MLIDNRLWRYLSANCLILGWLAGSISSEAAPTEPAATYHCGGLALLRDNPKLETLHKVFALPSAEPVEKLILKRLSALLTRNLTSNLDAGAIELLEPLVAQGLRVESTGEFASDGSAPRPFLLAFHLDGKDAETWHNTLDKILGRAAEKLSVDGVSGWRWGSQDKDALWLLSAHEWLLAGRGADFVDTCGSWLKSIQKEGRPVPPLTGKWLETEMDWSRMQAVAPAWVKLFKPCKVLMDVTAEQDSFRMTAHLKYPAAISWSGSNGNLATNLVHGPLVASFTMADNAAPFLNLNETFTRLDGSPLTNQFCAWALNGFPFLTYMAWPGNAGTLEKLAAEATRAFSSQLKDFNGTELAWNAAAHALVLMNLRVIQPNVQVISNDFGSFMLAGFFSQAPSAKPVPDSLWSQVKGRTNLVYYDWELTGPRLQQWRGLGRMVLTPARPPSEYTSFARMADTKWLSEMGPLVGNTITEVARVSPEELSVVRTGPLGLTAIELYLLSDWLNGEISAPNPARPAGP